MKSALDEAEGWVIAQIRGNNAVSDDKCLHLALSAFEEHFGLPFGGRFNVRARLERASVNPDALTPRGRACLWAMWEIKMCDWLYANVDGFDELGAWSLITDARETERRTS